MQTSRIPKCREQLYEDPQPSRKGHRPDKYLVGGSLGLLPSSAFIITCLGTGFTLYHHNMCDKGRHPGQWVSDYLIAVSSCHQIVSRGFDRPLPVIRALFGGVLINGYTLGKLSSRRAA